jgi:hypothetical protein
MNLILIKLGFLSITIISIIFTTISFVYLFQRINTFQKEENIGVCEFDQIDNRCPNIIVSGLYIHENYSRVFSRSFPSTNCIQDLNYFTNLKYTICYLLDSQIIFDSEVNHSSTIILCICLVLLNIVFILTYMKKILPLVDQSDSDTDSENPVQLPVEFLHTQASIAQSSRAQIARTRSDRAIAEFFGSDTSTSVSHVQPRVQSSRIKSSQVKPPPSYSELPPRYSQIISSPSTTQPSPPKRRPSLSAQSSFSLPSYNTGVKQAKQTTRRGGMMIDEIFLPPTNEEE